MSGETKNSLIKAKIATWSDDNTQTMFEDKAWSDRAFCVGGIEYFEGTPWRILSVENDRALIISKDIVAMKPYNERPEITTWEECTLRRWLNTDFLESLPTELQERVIEVRNQNLENVHLTAINSAPNTGDGNDTYDKVFLLSIDEALTYFSSDIDRLTHEARYESWWLRTTGFEPDRAADVNNDCGDISPEGSFVDEYEVGVRPALWLNIK
jgi:hypothetical protein